MLFGPCLTASKAAEVNGRVLGYGIVRLSAKQQSVMTPQTPSGVTHIPASPPAITVVTNRVPARHGIAFGMVYEISNLPLKDGEEIAVTVVVTCPAITRPDGSVSKGFAYTARSPVKDGVARGVPMYSFDHNYELAAGVWQFEGQYKGKTMAKQAFTVFRE